ncbi:unnamed protein product [Arctia plantaginis]|uniref:Uncharacterized protein n=1 Tax=Arctia plantaginis TaxID=874455 RepID=A0A8S0YRF7_ARCPL|nr:unnamed protein product [Arctia plantaginis]
MAVTKEMHHRSHLADNGAHVNVECVPFYNWVIPCRALRRMNQADLDLPSPPNALKMDVSRGRKGVIEF